MSELSNSMVRQYHENIEMKLQQRGGVLAQFFRAESQSSEKQFYEQMDSVTAEQVTTRFAESPVVNTAFDRRMVTITPYHTGDFLDSFERVQTLIDPKSQIVENFVRALQREKDRVIFNAIKGTAYSGKEGTTAVTYPTATTHRVDESFGTANSGLIITKLIEARRLWDELHNDSQDEQPFIIVNAAGIADLLNTTQVTSADYNSVKALVNGDVDTFMGFKFVRWQGYVEGSTNCMRGTSAGSGSETVDRYFVCTKSSLICATGVDVQTRITERSDRSFHWYAYAKAMFGAVRMQENKIVEIEAKR